MAKNMINIKIESNGLFIGVPSYNKYTTPFPQLKIVADYPSMVFEDGYKAKPRRREYWLSPFRGYCFQVSGSETGDGDYGSGKVIGIENVIKNITFGSQYAPSNIDWRGHKIGDPNSAVHELLKGLCMIAITEFIQGQAFREYTRAGCGYSLFIEKNRRNVIVFGNDIIDRFVSACEIYFYFREIGAFKEGINDTISQEENKRISERIISDCNKFAVRDYITSPLVESHNHEYIYLDTKDVPDSIIIALGSWDFANYFD